MKHLVKALKKVLAVSTSDLEFIADQLYNNESDTDESLADLLYSKTHIDKNKLLKFIKKERANFLGPKYSNNKKTDDMIIIKTGLMF